MFGLQWNIEKKDLASGIASGVGFAFGGPIGAAFLGGAVSFGLTAMDSHSWHEALEAGAVGAVFGFVPGGAATRLSKGMVGGAAKGLANGVIVSGKNGGLKALGAKIISAKAVDPQMIGASVFVGLMETAAQAFVDTGDSVESIPTRYLANDIGVDMDEMKMPDMVNPKFPDRYRFQPATEKFHIELPKTLGKYYSSFARDESAPMPPEGDPIASIRGVNRAKIANYPETVQSLQKAFNALRESGKRLAPLARESLEKSTEGKQAINAVIAVVNGAAGVVPKGGMTEDNHIFSYVTEALQSGDQAMNEAMKEQRDIGREMDNESEALKKLKEELEKLQEENADLRRRLLDPVDVTPPPSTPPPAANPIDIAPPPWAPPSSANGMDVDPGSSGPGAGNPGYPSDGITPTSPGLQAAAAPPTVQQPFVTSPIGSGMDLMSSLLPMIMQQAMMRNLADRDLDNRRAELDPRRFNEEIAQSVPAPVAAPVAAPSAPLPPATTVPAEHQQGQPSGATSSTRPAVAPNRTPGPDGSLVYTFPDGRTQKVSMMVAQALDAAFGNASGTDAQKAYEKTPAKWSDRKQIGDRVDPYQLMTGDVAMWDKRTAILVVFGSDEGGTLDAVVDGEMRTFAPEMIDKAGEFGQFAGFVHPKGIEVTALSNGDAPARMPGMVDQSATAATPVVVSPAG